MNTLFIHVAEIIHVKDIVPAVKRFILRVKQIFTAVYHFVVKKITLELNDGRAPPVRGNHARGKRKEATK